MGQRNTPSGWWILPAAVIGSVAWVAIIKVLL